MSQLTPQQEQAMATLKANLHLPGGGYHALIVDLCREYLLPFQQVRAELKSAQVAIETQIQHQFERVTSDELTKQHWLSIIRNALVQLADGNQTVMQSLETSEPCLRVIERLQGELKDNAERDILIAEIDQAYETLVCKPLMAMLYTSPLYWELSTDLALMTVQKQQQFSDYPQHIQAMAYLLGLRQQAIKAPLITHG
jgi:hypothetical protein